MFIREGALHGELPSRTPFLPSLPMVMLSNHSLMVGIIICSSISLVGALTATIILASTIIRLRRHPVEPNNEPTQTSQHPPSTEQLGYICNEVIPMMRLRAATIDDVHLREIEDQKIAHFTKVCHL